MKLKFVFIYLLIVELIYHVAEPQLFATSQKKFIELGWDIPDTQYLKENIENMEKTAPFDGVIFYIRANAGTKIIDTQNSWDTNRWERSWFLQAIDDLKKTRFQKFSDNFVRFNSTPGNIRWDDDDGWKNLCEKAEICAWIIRETNQKGLAIDFESYGKPQFKYDTSSGLSFQQCKVLARKRGRQFIQAIAKEKPDITILTLWLNSINFRAGNSEDQDVVLQGEFYGLLPSFADGMLDGLPQSMKIVDGCESGYYMDSLQDYLLAANNMRSWNGPAIRLVSEENHRKYLAQVQAGFGFYLDMYVNEKGNRYYFGPLDGSRLKRLYRNLSAAYCAADEYVWVYGEQCRWWTKPTQKNWYDNLSKTQGKGKMWEEVMPGLTRTILWIKNPLALAKSEIETGKANKSITNLVINNDFSTPPRDGVKLPYGFSSWQVENNVTGEFLWDKAVGNGSALARKVTWGCLIQKHKVSSGEIYYVSSEGLKNGSAHIDLMIRWQDLNGKWTAESKDAIFNFKPHTNGWLKAEGVVEVPENAGFLLILLNVKNQTGNKDDCWFDNIELYRLPPLFEPKNGF